MSRYRIAYCNATASLFVHCDGKELAHSVADALSIEGWAVEVRAEAESEPDAQDGVMLS